MNAFVKNLVKSLGIVMVLAGVACLVLYHFTYNLQENWFLFLALALEFAGILTHIILNKILD